LARVAADILRRRRDPPPDLALVDLAELPLPKSADNRLSRELICCLSESASDNFSRDNSIVSLDRFGHR
jgi:hypothetical protein